MQKKKTLSCLQDNVFLIVFQWPLSGIGTCHAFLIFPWTVFTELFGQTEFLHQGLRLRVMSAEITVDDCLVLRASFFKDFPTECA